MIDFRPYTPADHDAVRSLFIAVNRSLATPAMKDAFEHYIQHALVEEIDRLEDYYVERDGCFVIATRGRELAGMFGLERVAPDAMELRRNYVAPTMRRLGIGRTMLRHAETLAVARGAAKMALSTSELQPAALALYRACGFIETGTEIAEVVTNKTVGASLRRFYFQKPLDRPVTPR